MIAHFWGCTPMEVENAPLHRVEEARLVLTMQWQAKVRLAQRHKCSVKEVELPNF